MLFFEPTFLFFFLPLLLGVYQIVPARSRNALLAGASLFFYSWGYPPHIVILCGSIAVNHAIGLAVDRSATMRRRRLLLGAGVVANLGLLGSFKYLSFAAESINPLLDALCGVTLTVPQIDLPLGVSFFTFQALSYLVDVYRQEEPAQSNIIDLTLYIALFPQLIAGPIVRYGQIAAQIARRHVSRRGFSLGVQRFVLGLGKKVLIANTVARTADQVFALPGNELTPALAWTGLVCYTLQIYFDFSGYSDMAVGLGRMFGFHIPENFNHPYVARSVTEFWRRWHISLSSWFRDYLYIPLGGNRIRPSRTALNLLIVFFLCGLWHGASWNFVVWGLFHGSLLVGERLRRRNQKWRPAAPVGHAYTLLSVMAGWVLFRTGNLGEAWHYLGTMIGCSQLHEGQKTVGDVVSHEVMVALVFGIAGSMPTFRFIRDLLARLTRHGHERRNRRLALQSLHLLGNTGLVAVLLLSFMWVTATTYKPFIYFRF
jgi:alginate O-acetyltransferase complex protein AlgI